MKNPTQDLTGKTAIVTGASTGCGVIIAGALAEAGAKVVITARRAKELEEVAQRLRDEGGEVTAMPCDMRDAKSVDALVANTVARYGSLDIMVNNAGGVSGTSAFPERMPADVAEDTIANNMMNTWYGCRAGGAQMLAQGGGSIINIASAGAIGGWPDQPPLYCAAKAGVVSITQNLAVSWADRGVRVNAIALGWFPSEYAMTRLGNPDILAFACAHIPMRRIADLNELRGPILFLASDASSYVNGIVMPLDGGVLAQQGLRMSDPIEAMMSQLPGDLGRRIGARG